jgi:hypothetical protein
MTWSFQLASSTVLVHSPTSRIFDMNKKLDEQIWPRPGHAFAYRTKMEFEGFEPFEYELSVTTGADQLDLSNVIVGRRGGLTSADNELRQKLYYFMGSITVVSGHIEAAMKRLILTLQDHRTRQFSLVDKTWTDLHKILMKECQKGDEDPSRAELRRKITG